MRELSGEQQTEREEYPDVSAGPEPDKGKGWFWHGFAALGISALGLAVALAVALTTDAQTTRDLSAVPDTSGTVATTPAEKLTRNLPSMTRPSQQSARGNPPQTIARPEVQPYARRWLRRQPPSETSCWRKQRTRSAERPSRPAAMLGKEN